MNRGAFSVNNSQSKQPRSRFASPTSRKDTLVEPGMPTKPKTSQGKDRKSMFNKSGAPTPISVVSSGSNVPNFNDAYIPTDMQK